MKCRQLFAAAVLGATVFFGCGDECGHLESTYRLGDQAYTPAERSSDFNVSRGILVGGDVAGVLELMGVNFYEPNNYRFGCRVEGTDYKFEFFISKVYGDGSYEFIGSNSGQPAGSCRSSTMGAGDLDGVVGVVCGIQIPEKWECDSYGCWLVQEREHFGTVGAALDNMGVECFDWYYEDMYHQDSR